MVEVAQLGALNPESSISIVLAEFCKNPSLLRSSDIQLSDKDFFLAFHKIVYNAINNIVYSNASIQSINEADIDNFLSLYPKFYTIWQNNQGITYVHQAIEYGKSELFETALQDVKKYSLLRRYAENGVDVRDLYDYTTPDPNVINESAKRISEMSIQDIVNHYMSKMLAIRSDITQETGSDIVQFELKDDIDTLLERLNEVPEMGHGFTNPYFNTLFRGMREGKYMIRSASSGSGKTRNAIRDMLNVACDEVYETGTGNWIKTGKGYPILFISTELNKDELQTIALAYISGLETSEIEAGDFNKTQLMRLRKAVEVLKRSKMYFVYMEDFSVTDLEMIIEDHIINYGIKYCVFDYIQNNGKMSKALQEEFGHTMREDEIILNLSKKLKVLATKYNIFMMSSTQLNAKEKDPDNYIGKSEMAVRGAKSTIDKADYAMITTIATAKDLKALEPIMKKGFNKAPNYCTWIFKNRSGVKLIAIWSYYNMGNMREEPLFVTDYDYNLFDLAKTEAIDEDGEQGEIVPKVDF